LLQQLSGDSQVAYVNEDDEVGRLFGVFFCQVLAKNMLKTFGREPKHIQILAVYFDPSRFDSPQCFEHALVDERETRGEPAAGRNQQDALGALGICAMCARCCNEQKDQTQRECGTQHQRFKRRAFAAGRLPLAPSGHGPDSMATTRIKASCRYMENSLPD
jgi:hypothetical protein